MAEQYTYAVARIRAKEVSLLSRQDLEQVLSAKNEQEAVLILADKGFNGNGSFETVEKLLTEETEKTRRFISELIPDIEVFDVFLYADDFHNLKAAIKSVISGAEPSGIFVNGGKTPWEDILKAIKERDFSALPPMLSAPAEDAMDILLKTSDGQKADIIIDRAALTAIYKAGLDSDNELIKEYAELTVALSDIKIAVRGSITKKSSEFLKGAVADCRTIDTSSLIGAAAKGLDELYEYLMLTPYAELVEPLKKSYSEFEKQCDNLIMRTIEKQKSNPFTLGPVAAYMLARETEIKAVRIVLSGVINGLNENSVKERLRNLYV